jgi:hypothetical protein
MQVSLIQRFGTSRRRLTVRLRGGPSREFQISAQFKFRRSPGSICLLSPEVLERRRAQLRVARGVLDRSMTVPILDAPRVLLISRVTLLYTLLSL